MTKFILKSRNKYTQDKQQIGQLIIQLIQFRKKRGLTQKELAHKIGMTQSQIARVETLEAIPKLDTIFKILEGLELTIKISPEQKRARKLD